MTPLSRMASLVALLLVSLACYGQSVPDYTNFKPVFQEDVFILNPYIPDPSSMVAKKTPVNPAYALSESSALELAFVLHDYGATIFHSGPFGWLSSWGFAPTRAVPWLQFPDGTVANAGLYAWYWSHGYPPALVWLFVRSDLDALLKYGAEHPGIYDSIVRMP